MRVLFLLAVAGSAIGAAAQIRPDTTAFDSLRAYRLAEVVTVGERDAASAPGTMRRLAFAELQALDAPTAGEAIQTLPTTHVTTNSRGETLVYVQGTDSRNTPIYLDGALLTPPWDRRLDLRQIPTALLGGLRVRTGSETLLYGGRGYGGVVEFLTRSRRTEGRSVEVDLAGGWPEAGRGAGALSFRRGPWLADAAVTYDRQSGDALPEDARLPFSQTDAHVRLNTDYRLGSAMGRVGRTFGPGTQAGVTLLHLDAEKGIAPESHLDPALEAVRYWRYPSWQYDLGILSGEAARGARTWRGALWAGRQAQTIDQYGSAAFEAVEAQEASTDVNGGGRLLLDQATRLGVVRVAASGLLAQHEVEEVTLPGTAEAGTETRRFRHAEWNVGGTWTSPASGALRYDAGVGVQGFHPIETGPLPSRPGDVAFAGHQGLHLAVHPAVSVRVGLSTDVRFPTMRELFDGALGRFVVNPDLRPERAYQLEGAMRATWNTGSVEVLAFGRHVDGTIQQERLPDGQRRRINLGGSRAIGLDLMGAQRIMPRLHAEGFLNLLHVRGFTDDESGLRLDETPGALGRLQLRYGAARGLGVRMALRYTGEAYSPGTDAPIRLAPSLRVDGRLSYRWARSRSVLEAFARIDNVFDAVELPQAGLPAPGRTVRAGVKLSLDG